jgi:pSer/pThr/pTyr-binding forkhead associated (FHA) protein
VAPRGERAEDGAAAPAPEPVAAEPGTLTLQSTAQSTAFHPGGLRVEIRKFPFRIGREMDHEGLSGFGRVDLALPDHRPYSVSRGHCLIERKGEAFFVRDCGSRLGTIVNDIPLGAEATETSAQLKPGENHIILGTEGGRHEYTITVP